MKTMITTLFALLLALAFTGTVAAAERVNINTADVAMLDRVLEGIGPAKAAAIVEHRRVHGPFRTIDQLVNVKGIGMATLERNRDRITVGAAAPAPARASTTPPARAVQAPRTP